MEWNSRNTLLVYLLGSLLVIRFLLVPLIQWQDEYKWQLEQQQKRLLKANHAIENKDVLQQTLFKITETSKSFDALFYNAKSAAEFKLVEQQKIEAMLQEFGFKLVNLGWGQETEVDGTGLLRHIASIRFEGELINLPMFHHRLENQTELVEMSEFSISLNRQVGMNLNSFTASMDMVVYQFIGEKGEG